MTLRVRTERIDLAGGLLPLLGDATEADRFAVVRDGEGVVGWGGAARIDVGTGRDRFERAGRAVADLAAAAEVHDEVGVPGTGLLAFGSFTFAPDDDRSVLVVPRVVVGRAGDVAWRTTVGDGPPPPDPVRSVTSVVDADAARPRSAGSTVDEVGWLAAVAEAVTEVRRGPLRKVVMARDQLLWARRPFDVAGILDRLAARHPSCFTFLVDAFLGASPELLLEVRGDAVRSEVLAGTVGRGAGSGDDDAGAGLLASAKDREEHEFAVASVRDVLRDGCVDVDEDAGPHLLRLADVQHLATGLRGRLPGPAGPLGTMALLGALHPTAAVGGTPRDVALAAIGRLEGLDRARYAAPVGWVDGRGDATWAIALRCAEVTGDRARLFAGAGVVGASLPEDELRETRLKLRAMRDALGA